MKAISILSLILFSLNCIQATAQTTHTESDGFIWIEFSEFGKTGAKDTNGNVLIPAQKDLLIMYRNATYGGSLSLGYFSLRKWTGRKYIEGIADTKGNIIIPLKYDYASMSVKMSKNDTLLYFYTENKEPTQTTYYDYNGKKILTTSLLTDIDNVGEIINFDTKESLGIKIPSANRNLANFHHLMPTEIIKTPFGDFYATVKHEKDGTNWKLLTLSDNSICCAVSMNNEVLVPISDKAHDLEYKNGYFIGRQEGKEGKSFVYDSIGNTIISVVEGYNSIHRDIYTKLYFEARISTDTENSSYDAALYDLEGNLLIPAGEYSSISPQEEKGIRYFEVSRKDGSRCILDENLNPLITINDKDIFSIEYKKDELGVYYKISKSQENRKSFAGILSEKGTVIIAPNKYNLIDDRRVGNVAYYETAIIKENKSNKEYLHGLCDITGRELIAPEYDFITVSRNGKIELKKDDQIYTSDIDISRPTKFPSIKTGNLFYLINTEGKRINPIGYQELTYNEEKFCYTASIDGFSTTLSPSGTEITPILNQMFTKAYKLMDINSNEAAKLFTRIIELDENDYFLGLKSQSANNLGCICHRLGNKQQAIEYYKKALAYSSTNQIAQNNLDYMLHPSNETIMEEEPYTGWKIASNILGILNNAIINYKSIRQNHSYQNDSFSSSEDFPINNQRRNKIKGKKISDVQNERTARRTYNDYISQLTSMNTFRDRYNDNQRIDIQNSMRRIRQKWGFPKSDWEDWNGSER